MESSPSTNAATVAGTPPFALTFIADRPSLARIGEVLRDARINRGKGLRDLAEATGLRIVDLTAIERGEFDLTAIHLQSLLRELSLPVSEMDALCPGAGLSLMLQNLGSASGAEDIARAPVDDRSGETLSARVDQQDAAPRSTTHASATPSQGQNLASTIKADRPQPWAVSTSGEPTHYDVRASIPQLFQRLRLPRPTGPSGARRGRQLPGEIVYVWSSTTAGMTIKIYSGINPRSGLVNRTGKTRDRLAQLRFEITDDRSGLLVRHWTTQVCFDQPDWPAHVQAACGTSLTLAGHRPRCPICKSDSMQLKERELLIRWECSNTPCKGLFPLRRPNSLEYFPLRLTQSARSSHSAKRRDNHSSRASNRHAPAGRVARPGSQGLDSGSQEPGSDLQSEAILGAPSPAVLAEITGTSTQTGGA